MYFTVGTQCSTPSQIWTSVLTGVHRAGTVRAYNCVPVERYIILITVHTTADRKANRNVIRTGISYSSTISVHTTLCKYTFKG